MVKTMMYWKLVSKLENNDENIIEDIRMLSNKDQVARKEPKLVQLNI